MHPYRFRLTAAAVLFGCLLIGSLIATPTASAAITGSTITTPADLSFFIADYDASSQPFAISGTTSGGDPNVDKVDVNCYYGTGDLAVAKGVSLNQDGSFSVPDASLEKIANFVCRLRAVPAGTEPSDLTPYAGPRVGVGHRSTSKVLVGPNAGHAYDYFLYAQQLSGASDYNSLAECGLADSYLYDPTVLSATTITFYCNAFLWYQNYWEGAAPSTRSELQIDGQNAYPSASAQNINQNATGLPALSYSYSVDQTTGNLVIQESDPLVECPDQTYPPTATSCATFVSAGVTDNRTIEQDHDGHVVRISDVFTSTDGQAHSLDLLWDNDQSFQNGSHDSTQLEYEFPGESAYSTHAFNDVVSLPSSAGTVFARMKGFADGFMYTGQGAIVYDRPAASATFTYVNSAYEAFLLHQTGTVPAGGSTRFRFAYVQDYLAANVASMAQEASTQFADTLTNTLSVSRSGTGSGTVSSSPDGISCGATCSAAYAYGTPVTLTATPATGSTFTGWSGACSGTGTCTVTTDAAASVTAQFSLIPETLTVAKAGTGSGTVASSPSGISCGSTCSHAYDYGSSVTLTASPSTGSTFTGWSGSCSGTGSCIVITESATSVTANFSLIPETLSVTSTGDGLGTITSIPAGISCGTSCSHEFSYGSSVTLTATAGNGSSFAGWSGACSGAGPCVLSMQAAQSVQAAFVKNCLVPKLKGKTLSKARHALTINDCRLGKVKHTFSSKVKKGHVVSQKPKPHRQLSHDAKVAVVISKGKKH